MSDEGEIAKLVETLGKFKPGKPLKNYIAYAVFPKFKSIEAGARVDFEFPLTALVGANGIGKSSLLHALWGMPYGYSTSKFCFSTALDPIQGTQKDPQRYFYGHWSESFGGIVETRKARVGRKRDYWEPARRSGPDGMAALPSQDYEGKVSDRWNPVRRDVVYINLKATFGSFDRYFYFDEGGTAETRRHVMLKEAKRLKTIKDDNRQSYKLGGRERLFENRDLTQEELEQVSKILGRTYESARLVRHSLFPGNRGQDLSVVFRRGVEYSEAFAGSGEIAAVSAVVQILAAKEYSLILLDEPETSLHPGAQRALQRLPGCTRFEGKDGMRDPETLGDELMTVDALEKWIVRWLYENWVNTPLDRLRWDELLVDSVKGKTPLERLNYLVEEMGHPITMPPPRQEWMAALFDHKMCTLSAKTGITLEHGFHYKGEAMSYLLAKYGDHAQLHVVYNPDDFRQAYVYEDDDLPLVTLTHEHVRPQTPAWTFAEAKARFDSGIEDWMVPDDKVKFQHDLDDAVTGNGKGRKTKPRGKREENKETVRQPLNEFA